LYKKKHKIDEIINNLKPKKTQKYLNYINKSKPNKHYIKNLKYEMNDNNIEYDIISSDCLIYNDKTCDSENSSASSIVKIDVNNNYFCPNNNV
jgi:hypothetical protein